MNHIYGKHLKVKSKVLNGLERISEALKSLLWEKAKNYGVSPIQIQILLFVSSHHPNLSNVSSLAKEFNVSKATVSEAVRILIKKDLLTKDFSPQDNRRFNLLLTEVGQDLVNELSDYSAPIEGELDKLTEQELTSMFQSITKLIYQLNRQGIIQVQRTCYNCMYYSGDKEHNHFCNLMKSELKDTQLRLDCDEFSVSE